MKQRAYLYFLSTFLLGVVVGGVGLFLYAWYGGHWRRPGPPRDFVQYLNRELKLDAQQTSQLTQILDEGHKKYDALHAQVRPQFEALRQETDNQIRQILNPEQSQKFDEVIRKWRPGPGPGPPGPRHGGPR
jgi:hypothetical protein